MNLGAEFVLHARGETMNTQDVIFINNQLTLLRSKINSDFTILRELQRSIDRVGHRLEENEKDLRALEERMDAEDQHRTQLDALER